MRDRRELSKIAAEFGLTYVGTTTKGHYRWLHEQSGRILTSISNFNGNRRALANVRRTFKTRLREIGVTNEHATQD